MNVHSPVTPAAERTLATIDSLDELHALLEAIHMMASDLDANQANALQRVAIIGQGLIEDLKERLRPSGL